jgi:hypothetical protein
MIKTLSTKLEIIYDLGNSSITFSNGSENSTATFNISVEGDTPNSSAVFNDFVEFEEIYNHFKKQFKKATN